MTKYYQRSRVGVIAAGFFFWAFAARAVAPVGEAERLVRAADDVRNPSESYKMTIEIKTPDSESNFEVFLKGKDRTVVVSKSPARDRGRNMLMLDRDFYAYVPNLKRSVRLSLSQKLSGQVANGDITRTRWSGDYKAQLVANHGAEAEILLDGLKNNLTYQKIRLWVNTKTNRPLHADYLSLDGNTVLKSAIFGDYKKLSGAERPALIRIRDAAGQESTMKILSMESTKLDDAFFTEQNMESLR